MPVVAVSDADIVDMILRHEGGTYTNHPNDRGGPTKWGITIPVLTAFLGRQASVTDIQQLTRERAGAIYHHLFIRPFSRIPVSTFRANVIDMGVNAGVGRGIRLLQQTIGAVVDGKIGPQTASLVEARDWNPLFVGVRLAFYERIIENDPSQIVWRNGWRNRSLSFYGKAHRLLMRTDDAPAYGHTGKAYAA